MVVHSFHLAMAGPVTTATALIRPPTSTTVPGLVTAECMTTMDLGLAILSPSRLQMRRLAVFAAWENEEAIDDFLDGPGLGGVMASGWHVRLELLRRWGLVSGFDQRPNEAVDQDPQLPVVAVTLARLALSQLPRFIRWGQPAERLVRDHPGATLGLAAMRPARTLATFSVWRTQHEMTEMVSGHSEVPGADRHAAAMEERRRKDFHHEFTVLRFRPVAEHGTWQGRSAIVPTA